MTASRPQTAASSITGGAADPASAVHAFVSAAKAQDLQAMSLVWGTSAGPARASMNRDELEKREIVIVRCITHDSYAIIGDAPGLNGKRVFAVALKRRDLTRTTNFNAVPGPSGRWFVESVDMEPLQEFCNRR